MWRKPVQMIRLATSTPGHVEVNRWSATVHSRAPELRLQQSLCFYFSSAGLTALPLRIVEEMPWTFLHLFFLFLQSSTSSIWKQTWNYAIAILGDGEANHFEFQIYRHKWRRFRSEEGNTNLNKFFHFDENVEIYREMRLWSVPCIGCSSSCFGVLYATTVDWQMIQRYLRHLSFYSAPSCLREDRHGKDIHECFWIRFTHKISTLIEVLNAFTVGVSVKAITYSRCHTHFRINRMYHSRLSASSVIWISLP